MFQYSSLYQTTLENSKARIQSLDILRGVVMVLMALDHCRHFFHVYASQYEPEDLNFTTPIVFYTRFVTHFCAPVFVLLTGISAYMYKTKNNATNKQLANYLLVRGLILIFLELTIVRFSWRFYIDYSSIGGLILWAIGWSMIALAGLIYLKRKLILWISILIIFCHNFLDTIVANQTRFMELVWAFLHVKMFVKLTEGFGVNILYPVLPMIGIIGLGYYLGKWYTYEYSKEIRSGYLFYLGVAFISLFVSLRFLQLFTEQFSYLFYLNVEDLKYKDVIDIDNILVQSKVTFKGIITYIMENYGDPSPWRIQEDLTYTVMAFFNTTKYPMSLLYILMTLGPSFLLLSYLEDSNNKFWNIFQVYGKVPLFYYVVHLFLIHAMAVLLFVITHLSALPTILDGNLKEAIKDYGYKMPIVYVLWIVLLVLLYPMCNYYRKIKSKSTNKILSYL